MRKYVMTVAGLVVLALICGAAQAGESTWKPSKPITVRVGAAAGGGSDTICRALAAAIKDIWGVNIQVINNQGGSGGIAINTVWKARHDGYTVVGASDSMPPHAVTGAFEHTVDVWDWMVGGGGHIILSVHSDSPYQTLDELLEAAAKEEMRVGASSPTTTLGLKYAQLAQLLEEKEGIKFNFLSYEGSAPTHVAGLSKEIDIIITAAGEQLEYLKAGSFRPLAALELEDVVLEGMPPIKSITNWYPEFRNLKQVSQWWGWALPKDVPEEIRLAYHQAFQQALQTEVVKNAFKSLVAPIFNDGKGYVGEEADRYIKDAESASSWILYDGGLVTISPEQFGIER